LQYVHPFSRRIVPSVGIHTAGKQRASIIIVPTYLVNLHVARAVVQDRKQPSGTEADTRVAIRVTGDTVVGEDFIGFGKLPAKVSSGSEAIDQERCATLAISMGKQMEHLETDRICEVSRICVSLQCEIRIRGILGGEI